MERVGVLIKKLQDQLSMEADVHKLLVTTQLLHNELLLMSKGANGTEWKKVSVMVPGAMPTAPFSMPEEAVAEPVKAEPEPGKVEPDPWAFITEATKVPEAYKPVFQVPKEPVLYKPVPHPEPEPEPIHEPVVEPETHIPEPTPAPTPKPEPEPIPHFIEQKPWMRFPVAEEKAAAWNVDPVLEIPTLAHQQKVVFELNDVMLEETNAASINDRLKENKTEMAMLLKESPVKDLKKAISINDRHRFINELFRGDETMYERSIKTINGFHIYAEAEYWIQRELKVKLGWDSGLELVKTFDQLVKRRFS